MSERRRPWSPPDQEEGPTRPMRHPDHVEDLPSFSELLTEEDIDEVETVERGVPAKLVKPIRPILPKLEQTGTITLPKSFLASEPVTLRKNPTPLPPPRYAPPPKPLRLPPPPRFEAPAPPPGKWRSVVDEMDQSVTPIMEPTPPVVPIELRPRPKKRSAGAMSWKRI